MGVPTEGIVFQAAHDALVGIELPRMTSNWKLLGRIAVQCQATDRCRKTFGETFKSCISSPQ